MTWKVDHTSTQCAQGMLNVLHRLAADLRESVTLLIVAVCAAVFMILATLDLFYVVNWTQALLTLGLSYVGVVQHYWLFQFLTAPLIHANVTHLAFNMLTLSMLGPSIEQALGRRRYMIFSVLCAITSMLGFLIWNWERPMIGFGYSGVIYGILVAQATFFPNRTLYIFAFFPLKMKHAVLVLGAVTLYLSVVPDRSDTGHAAHLFGALGAWMYIQLTRCGTVKADPKTARPKLCPAVKPIQRKSRTEIPWKL